ncbi:hypothetical protein COX08_01760 [Candidatus Beckwithbacteria bacterium CG23_combo_of_CG06-09_8_20_14_all_34_8]|uniref:Cytidylate kinase n=1 Tax=Candidatus Beckwithbacteria bacterium CG23_combo_of_CG06-09_8_20_14_all_34_8 TaxID=1974497 RepID=A0A2H0B6N9_9BACT|nr:MAG: hypothetical protein COX08_01760 [Candidatus Beckwithbacteria bacterium CG23_combo_of_CG06-09_8_20_14_all_34_8]
MLNYQKMIDQNFQYSEIMKQILDVKKLPVEIFPTITVSRDPGSGGRDIAEKVASKLGLEYLEKKKLMKMIVKKAGLDTHLVEEALREETLSPWESIINNFLGLKKLDEYTFIRTLIEVLLETAAKKPFVVLGRGANFILPPEATLRVRVTAPRRVLIKYAMQFENKNRMEARQTIDKYLKSRRDYVYKYFSKDIKKSHYYDLCLSTEFLSIDQATDIAVAAFKGKFDIR